MTGHDEQPEPARGERDVVAELVRAVGRRAVPSPDAEERVRAAAYVAWQHGQRTRRRRRWSYALAASLVAAAIVVSVLWLPRIEAPFGEHGGALVSGELEYRSGDSWQPLALALGTDVPIGVWLRPRVVGGAAFSLDGGGALRVAAVTTWRFTASRRIDLETGALYLDSGGSGRGGFEIATPFGMVRDIGTQFEVRAADAGLSVSVREGSVQLEQSSGRLPIQAGERLTLGRDGAVARADIAPSDAAWDWAEALAEPLRIDGRSTYEVLTWVARETGRRLVFADSIAELRARNSILSGGDTGLPPREALAVAVAATDGLDYVLEEDSLIVRLR